jgi:hypothetical protein
MSRLFLSEILRTETAGQAGRAGSLGRRGAGNSHRQPDVDSPAARLPDGPAFPRIGSLTWLSAAPEMPQMQVMENPMWISSHMSLSSFLAFIGLILEILVSRSRNSDCMAKSATVLAANDEL